MGVHFYSKKDTIIINIIVTESLVRKILHITVIHVRRVTSVSLGKPGDSLSINLHYYFYFFSLRSRDFEQTVHS